MNSGFTCSHFLARNASFFPDQMTFDPFFRIQFHFFAIAFEVGVESDVAAFGKELPPGVKESELKNLFGSTCRTNGFTSDVNSAR